MDKGRCSVPILKWKADNIKDAVLCNFQRRGWSQCKDEDDDWNFYWATVSTVKQIFNPDSRYRLHDGQLLNHFPNHYELTRKDLMVKNIKRYRKDLAKDLARAGRIDVEELDFLPSTFMLPSDYSLFLEEHRRKPNTTWIMKPCNKAQGRGIFIISKLSQMKKWAGSKWKDEPYIISVYINNPFLIGQKKFDLRIYVLVTSYRPLRVYIHKEGFARFCNVNYSSTCMDNMFMHLTNVAIQKHYEDYNKTHGGKWTLSLLKLYVESTYGTAVVTKLLRDMELIILHSIKAVQNVMISDKHCFECYGYDLLIDDTLKPWLVEVNASPSLSATTYSDRMMKQTVMDDVMKVVVPAASAFPSKLGANSCRSRKVGGFELLYDETVEFEERRKGMQQDSKSTSARWR